MLAGEHVLRQIWETWKSELRGHLLQLEPGFEIASTALAWPRVRIDAGGLQVGVAQGGGYEGDGGPVVDGVRCMCVTQSVDRCGRVEPAIAVNLCVNLWV